MVFSSTFHNLGFLLQVNGMILLLPIIIAEIFGEAITPFLLTSLISLAIGFSLTSIFKKEKLDFTSTCCLFFLAFLILGVIGTIPYVLLNIFKENVFLNGYFEAISGYTTTGLTLIKDVESLPKSLIFFRSLTQWVGGVNVIFLFLIFFASTTEARVIGEVSGFEKITPKIKNTFFQVFKLYVCYTLLFIFLFYFFGNIDLFNSIQVTFTGLSTGGFSPVNEFKTLINRNSFIITIALIFCGATNFLVHYNFWKRKIGRIFNIEFKFYVLWAIISLFIIIFLSFVADLNFLENTFHTISAFTTAGFSIGNIKNASESIKLFLIILMFVGGSYFSTAGGIKFVRFLITLKSIPWIIKKLQLPPKAVIPLNIENKVLFEKEVLIALSLVILSIFSLIIFSFIFSLYGFPLIDSLFELTSALATTGLSTGITSLNLPFLLKGILIFQMVIGRIEILPFLVFLRSIGKLGKF